MPGHQCQPCGFRLGIVVAMVVAVIRAPDAAGVVMVMVISNGDDYRLPELLKPGALLVHVTAVRTDPADQPDVLGAYAWAGTRGIGQAAMEQLHDAWSYAQGCLIVLVEALEKLPKRIEASVKIYLPDRVVADVLRGWRPCRPCGMATRITVINRLLAAKLPNGQIRCGRYHDLLAGVDYRDRWE